MSYHWLAIAVQQKAPSTHAYAVLCALAGYADDGGKCFPSQKRLAEQTRQTERSVVNQLNALEASGYIQRTRVQGRKGYRLIAKDQVQHVHLHEKVVHSQQGVGDEPISDIHEADSKESESHAPPSKPVNEPVSELIPPKSPTPQLVLPVWLPEEAWNDFVDHRLSMKKPLSEKAKELSLRALEKLRHEANDPVEVINQSIMRGWAGLFEIKEHFNGTKKTAKYTDADALSDVIAEIDDRCEGGREADCLYGSTMLCDTRYLREDA